MPFLVQTDDAHRIARAIARQRRVYTFPDIAIMARLLPLLLVHS